MTQREAYIEGLKALGETEVSHTYKFIKFSRKEGGYYYLGRSGSLRIGPTVRGSVPASTTFKAKLRGAS